MRAHIACNTITHSLGEHGVLKIAREKIIGKSLK